MASNKDINVLSCLRQNSRENVVKIARKTRMPVSTVSARLKKLEKNVIRKHTALLDLKKIGFATRTKLIFSHHNSKLDNFLIAHENVNSVFKLNNNYLLADVIFRDLKEYYSFLDSLSEISSAPYRTHHIVEEIKNEEFTCFSVFH